MNTPYFDIGTLLFQGVPMEKLTAQQRANINLFRAMLEAEFSRGFERGRVVGRMESEKFSVSGLDDSAFLV